MLKKILIIILLTNPLIASAELTGKITPSLMLFVHEGLKGQAQTSGSIALEPEYHQKFNQQKDNVGVKLFWRQDQRDNQRTHGDIRELYWQHIERDWEVLIGLAEVFWGVAETQHLVNIINQIDLVENIDEEERLGQPMIKFSLIRDWGTWDVFLLPYFRERTFPGVKGRLRTCPRVDIDNPIYESSREKKHIDWAFRWAHSADIWDIGVSFFTGTSREPRLIGGVNKNEIVFYPFYEVIQQLSLDLQATTGNWLWKVEFLTRRGQGKTFNANVVGAEYTFVGVSNTGIDLGTFLEYHHDGREPSTATYFNNDVAAGLRFNFNDEQSTEALIFLLYDRKLHTKVFRYEFSRRIGDDFKLGIEGNFFSKVGDFDPLTPIRRDDFIRFDVSYYF